LVKLLQDKAATASDKSAAITATAEQATDTLRAMAKDPKIQSVFRQLFNALLRRPK
jgi:succinyl-CoA synthetase beta subunit